VSIGRQEVGVGFGHWDGLRAALAGGGGAPVKGELRGGDGGGGEGGRRGEGDARMGRGEESVEGDEGGAYSTSRKVMGRRTRRVAGVYISGSELCLEKDCVMREVESRTTQG
jgi:hypothetical protein